MEHDSLPSPRLVRGVMISGTFTDLKEHRAVLIRAVRACGLADLAMENDSARPGLDVIDSSLQMVREGAAYVGVISRKYGQTPNCPRRNPRKVSITELEFDEALKLGRPVLLFIMGERHPLIEADVERSAAKRKKLEAFRERAKLMGPDSQVHRVYSTFESLDEFKEQAFKAVADLRRYLDEQESAPQPERAPAPDRTKPDPIPAPPAFYAEPPYIGSHEFLGRQAQLDTLDDWAAPADSHPILLFEAIGGAGKSILTWEWTTKRAAVVRDDWAGRFWYSFYEKGAIMADFCRRALAYMTRRPLEDFRKKRTLELGDMLLRQLQTRPWLLVLDGLERVLVAYHRFDAAQLADEEAGTSDQIARRDPCSAIRPEDDELLRAMAAAAPSKLLVTSRLIPRVLLNSASQPIPGVLHERLPGLRPADAEALLRACGVNGTQQAIQSYLKAHCDCHPLVTGVLAGLINDYLPDRGNFDAWVDDPDGGGRFNLADLDLVQKRNHILHAALAALPPKSRELLSTLALLYESVDYPTLSALNPHLPPEPEKVEEPKKPEDTWRWERISDEEKEEARKHYEVLLQRRAEYEQALKARRQSPEFLAAPQELTKTVRDLERRGLLQYDAQTKRHDLHPVVRGVAAGRLRQEEKELFGQRVVDHFSQQAHSPYEQAETLEDLRNGLHVVRTLLQMGRYQKAYNSYSTGLDAALQINLEAYAEILSILRPFFPHGWSTLPDGLSEYTHTPLLTYLGNALGAIGELKEALAIHEAALMSDLQRTHWGSVRVDLKNISITLLDMNRLAKSELCRLLALEIAELSNDKSSLFSARLSLFQHLMRIGRWDDAEAMWQLLDPMGRDWPRSMYLPGNAERAYAEFRFQQGELSEMHLTRAEEISRSGRSRGVIRYLHRLRGEWYMEQGRWALAADSFSEAVRMAREVGQSASTSETKLAIAKFHLNQLSVPHHEAEELANTKDKDHHALGELWRAIGDAEQAKKHALAAYKEAWADGEPYVFRYELNKARALLEQLGAEIPELEPYDPAKDERFPWEEEIEAAIKKLRAEKEAKEAGEKWEGE